MTTQASVLPRSGGSSRAAWASLGWTCTDSAWAASRNFISSGNRGCGMRGGPAVPRPRWRTSSPSVVPASGPAGDDALIRAVVADLPALGVIVARAERPCPGRSPAGGFPTGSGGRAGENAADRAGRHAYGSLRCELQRHWLRRPCRWNIIEGVATTRRETCQRASHGCSPSMPPNLPTPTKDLFQESTMTFGEHLEELRACLFKAIVGLALGCVVGLVVGGPVVEFIQTPVEDALENYYAEAGGRKVVRRRTSWRSSRGRATRAEDDIERIRDDHRQAAACRSTWSTSIPRSCCRQLDGGGDARGRPRRRRTAAEPQRQQVLTCSRSSSSAPSPTIRGRS